MKLGLVAIIFIVFLHMLGISVSEFHTELDYTYKYDVTEWAHNDTGYGVYLK